MTHSDASPAGLLALVGTSFLGVGLILVAELFGGLLAGGAVVCLLGAIGFRDIPAGGKEPAMLGALLIALALLPLGWVMKGIWRPKVRTVGVIAHRSVRFAFVTSHPSYVALDLVTLPLWLLAKAQPAGPLYNAEAIRAERIGEIDYHALIATIAGVLVMVAVARILAWYGLRRRVDAKGAWLPVALVLVAAGLLVAGIAARRAA